MIFGSELRLIGPEGLSCPDVRGLFGLEMGTVNAREMAVSE
jgi:hypothetical protein